MNEIIATTILLTLIMDPLGNLPIFMAVLKKLEPKRQIIIIIREMMIALIIMLLFLFFGENILKILNLQTETVSISGGIILFLISIQMIFPSEKSNNHNEIYSNEEPFLVPLAIPLVAGPSLLATLMLLSHQYLNHIWYLLLSLFIAWFLTIAVLLLSSFFLRCFGTKGANALERLMGLILIMLSTQMFLDGIKIWLNH